MDVYRLEAARRIFSAVRALLEESSEIAASGESTHLSPANCRSFAVRLNNSASEIVILSQAALVLAKRG